MNFCVLSCHSPEYKCLADITLYGVLAEYCKRWGYDLIIRTECDPQFAVPGSHAGGRTWDRLNHLLRMMTDPKDTHDWFYVVGADALVMNFNVPLTTFVDPAFHFIIACDVHDYNADSFLMKKSPESIAYLQDIMALWPNFKTDGWVEQRAMTDPAVKAKWSHIIKILPQRVLNAYDYTIYPYPTHKAAKDCNGNDGQWHPGDFLIHWPGCDLSKRMQLLHKYLPLIQR